MEEKELLKIAVGELMRIKCYIKNTIETMQRAQERLNVQTTKLYRISIRMSNDSEVFSRMEKERIELLFQIMGHLWDMQENERVLAESVQTEVNKAYETMKEVEAGNEKLQEELLTEVQHIGEKVTMLCRLNEDNTTIFKDFASKAASIAEAFTEAEKQNEKMRRKKLFFKRSKT